METEYRVILGWNPDGSGLVYKRCIACGEYKVLATGFYFGANVCKECSYKRSRETLERKREEKRKEEELRQAEEEEHTEERTYDPPTIETDTDQCWTCRSYSEVVTAYNARKRGWCMRNAKSVYADDTCGKHKYPMEGKFAKEAVVSKWW